MNNSTTQEHFYTILETVDILLELLKLLDVTKAISQPDSSAELVEIYLSETDKYLNGMRDCVMSALAEIPNVDSIND